MKREWYGTRNDGAWDGPGPPIAPAISLEIASCIETRVAAPKVLRQWIEAILVHEPIVPEYRCILR